MAKTKKEKIENWFNKNKAKVKDSKKRPRIKLDGKNVNLLGIAKGQVYTKDGMNYPIFKTSGMLSSSKLTKDFRRYKKALDEDGSRESYIKIATEVDKSLTSESAGALFDFANNKEMRIKPDVMGNKPSKEKTKFRGSPVTDNKKEEPVNEKALEKSKVSPDIKYIKGRSLYTHLLKKGEAGIYWNGQIYPIFKDPKKNKFINSWSFVRADRTDIEKRLFIEMSKKKSAVLAQKVYYKFMIDRGIPEEVIDAALVAINEMPAGVKKEIERTIRNRERQPNFDKQFDIGFNLDKLKINDADFVKRTVDYIKSAPQRNKNVVKFIKEKTKDMIKSGIKAAVPAVATAKFLNDVAGISVRQGQMRYGNYDGSLQPAQAAKLASDALKAGTNLASATIIPAVAMAAASGGGGGRKLRGSEGDSQEDSEGITVTDEDTGEKINPETGEPSPTPSPAPSPSPTPEASAPPPPEASPPSPEEIEKGEAERAKDKEGDIQEEEFMKEELEKDFIPDVSKYGHTMAVQNIFTRFNKDFTYFKNLVSNTELKPSDNKKVRKMQVDRIIAEYSSLFPIEKVSTD